MLTRLIRVQLTIFTIVALTGVGLMIFSYLQVPTLLGIGRITVTLELPATGGLYRFSNVTYRGVQVGKVIAVELDDDTAKAKLSLGTSPKIPVDLRAEIRSISAVGEQYVDLRPHADSPPYLRDGSVIPMDRITIPQPVGPMLDRVNALITSIPKDKLHALLDESFKGFNGSGYDLGSLLDSSERIASDSNSVSGDAAMLFEDARSLLDSQAQTADSIRRWAHSTAGLTEQLTTDDNELRRLLQTGPGTADEATRLLEQVKPTLPVLLANLTTIGQVAVTYHPSLEQLLVLLPPIVAELQTAFPTNNYVGMAPGGFHVSISDPPACTVGFLPPSEWRSPAIQTTIDTPDGLYCKLPQDSPTVVRGARNYPCMGHPGKRAPTVEICNSDKPFEPLAMRQHFAGPYPLDPNLISQGVPPDDRITSGDRIFGPPGGTPLPPAPALPSPPSLGTPGPIGNGPGAPEAGPPFDATTPPPSANLVSPPPLGPLTPMDTPDSDAPAPGTPSTAQPPASGRPSAAPSSFGTGQSGTGPLVAIAQYNPSNGSYVGPDGHLYWQSDLVTSADHPPKTWKDLILK